MKHQNPDDLKSIAEAVSFGSESMTMSRAERLERWATVLERHEGRLNPLEGVEYFPRQERAAAHAYGSPLDVAYRDPILRGEGLAGNRFGDAMAFFDLTEDEAHHALCDCHYRGTMTGKAVADRLRSYMSRVKPSGLWNRFYMTIARWI